MGSIGLGIATRAITIGQSCTAGDHTDAGLADLAIGTWAATCPTMIVVGGRIATYAITIDLPVATID